jgi:hypothetical protein
MQTVVAGTPLLSDVLAPLQDGGVETMRPQRGRRRQSGRTSADDNDIVHSQEATPGCWFGISMMPLNGVRTAPEMRYARRPQPAALIRSRRVRPLATAYRTGFILQTRQICSAGHFLAQSGSTSPSPRSSARSSGAWISIRSSTSKPLARSSRIQSPYPRWNSTPDGGPSRTDASRSTGVTAGRLPALRRRSPAP